VLELVLCILIVGLVKLFVVQHLCLVVRRGTCVENRVLAVCGCLLMVGVWLGVRYWNNENSVLLWLSEIIHCGFIIGICEIGVVLMKNSCLSMGQLYLYVWLGSLCLCYQC
jgi:hypothetical protein